MKLNALAMLTLLTLTAGCRHSPPPVPAPLPAPRGDLSLAAGSVLAFKTAQAIDLPSSRPGQTFAVVVSRDANVANGQRMLPSGSPATLIVLEDPSGKPTRLGLASVMLNGDSYLVGNQHETELLPRTGVSLGTFLGGVAGTEPYAGPPAQLSAQEAIRCPPGSLLTFRLETEIVLQGARR